MATKKPLVYRDDLGGVAGTPAPGDTIDPTYLPPTTPSSDGFVYAFFVA